MPIRLRPWIPPFACLAALAGPGRAIPVSKVLEQGPGRMRLEILVPAMRSEEVPGQGWRIACDGCQVPPAGSPDLPVFRVDVPAGETPGGQGQGGNGLRAGVRILEAENLAAGKLAPVPRTLDAVRIEYRPDPAAEAAMARGEVRVLEPQSIRGLRTRGVLIPLARPVPGGAIAARRLDVDLAWDPAFEAGPRRPPARKRGVSAAFPDLGERFFRIRVGDATVESLEEDRVYSVAFGDLAAKSRDIRGGVRIGDLRLYRGPRDTLTRSLGALPGSAGELAGTLREIPMEVVDDGDGTFDDGDTLRFFAHGTSLWKRAAGPAGPVRFVFSADPYAFGHDYFLAWSGKGAGPARRLEAAPVADVAGPVREVNRAYLRAERESAAGGCDVEGHADSTQGAVRFWHVLGLCRGVGRVSIPGGLVTSPSAVLQDWAAGTGDSILIGFRSFPPRNADEFGVYMAGGKLPLPYRGEPGSDGDAWYAWEGPAQGGDGFPLDSLVWNGGSLALEGYSIRYPRNLVWRGKPLWIFPETGGRSAWRVRDGAGLLCLRIVDGVGESLLRLDSEGRFADSLPEDADALYLVYDRAHPLDADAIAEDGLPEPGGALRDLAGGGGNRPEYLIMAPRALEREALALRDYRRDARRAEPLRAEVVRLEDVYRNFSSGRLSPTALRDFLRWALHRWEPGGAAANPLRYVLLFGNGHYDYRGIDAQRRAAPPLHVPTYQAYSGREAIATDDFFARLDSGETDLGTGGLDLAVGRLPAQTAEEAAAYLEKAKAWEDPGLAGEWRSRFLFAADDHLQRGRPGDLDDITWGHTNDTEKLARRVMAGDPAAFVERVYLLDYPLNSAFRKPQATQDLLGFMDRGVAAVNFVGHGSADQWADEVLLRTSDVQGSLSNRGRTPMVNAFSCMVGRYDAFLPGLSQVLVSAAGKGAIASISATRESFPLPNIALADAFYSLALPGGATEGSASVGEALNGAKNLGTDHKNPVNDAKYNLLGEPVLRLRKPGLRVVLAKCPDTLRALDCGTIQGTVEGGGGSGFLNVKILGAPEHRVYALPKDMDTQYVARRGPVIFSQTVPYVVGRFSLEYLIPARVPFGDTAARITAFAWDGGREMEGSIAVEGLAVRGQAGEGSCPDPDGGQGPRIRVTGCQDGETGGVDFPDRVRLDLPSCLRIQVEDSSGGVLSAQGPDEGTMVEIPGSLPPFHPQPGVDELFLKTYQLTLEAKAFRPGPHLLKVSAQDGYGNRSLRQIRLDLGAVENVRALSAYNVPNPVKRSGTAFYFSVLLPEPEIQVTAGGGDTTKRVEFEVRIHDQRGRVVKVLRNARSGQRWDGRDEWGRPLANGVYYYIVTARWNRQAEKPAAGESRPASSKRNILVLSR